MDDVESLEVDDDYYAFLNLSREVSVEFESSLVNFSHVSQSATLISYFRPLLNKLTQLTRVLVGHIIPTSTSIQLRRRMLS